jgi:preprotein translocase subunit SecY
MPSLRDLRQETEVGRELQKVLTKYLQIPQGFYQFLSFVIHGENTRETKAKEHKIRLRRTRQTRK